MLLTLSRIGREKRAFGRNPTQPYRRDRRRNGTAPGVECNCTGSVTGQTPYDRGPKMPRLLESKYFPTLLIYVPSKRQRSGFSHQFSDHLLSSAFLQSLVQTNRRVRRLRGIGRRVQSRSHRSSQERLRQRADRVVPQAHRLRRLRRRGRGPRDRDAPRRDHRTVSIIIRKSPPIIS